MMVILFLILILCIDLVVGMDSDSYASESSIEEHDNLKEYTKQERNFHDLNFNADDQQNVINDNELENCETKKNSALKNSSEVTEEKLGEYNELKRKHKPEKVLPFCGYCNRKSTNGRFINGLCHACYEFKRLHGKLIPLDERTMRGKHNIHILVCEFCQQESTSYRTGKKSGKSLCKSCYNSEYLQGRLVPLDERPKRYNAKYKDHKRVCEFCQKESPLYTKSKINEQILCKKCYNYECYHGHLIPLDERRKPEKYKDRIGCEYCQKESTKYIKGKYSSLSLCIACYAYESRYGHLLPLDERTRHGKYKKDRNNQHNRLMTAEKFQKKTGIKDQEETGIQKQFQDEQKESNDKILR